MSAEVTPKIQPPGPREFLVTAFSSKPESKGAPSKDILWSEVWHGTNPLPVSHPFRWVLHTTGETIQIRNMGSQGEDFSTEPVDEIPLEDLAEKGLFELGDKKKKSGCWILVQPVPAIRDLENQSWQAPSLGVGGVSEAASNEVFKRTSWTVSAVMVLSLLVMMLIPKPDEEELIPEEFAKVLLSPALKENRPVPQESASQSKATNVVKAFKSKIIQRKTKSLFSAQSANRLLGGSTLLNAAKSSKKARKVFDVNSAIGSAVNKDKLEVSSKEVSLVGKDGKYSGGTATVAGQGKGVISVPAADTDVSVGLTKDQVGQTIRKYMADVRYCYEAALIRNPTLEGKLVMDFTVRPTGSVGRRTVKQSSSDNVLDQCIVQKLSRWKFPKPKGGVSVDISYPFIFKVLGG